MDEDFDSPWRSVRREPNHSHSAKCTSLLGVEHEAKIRDSLRPRCATVAQQITRVINRPLRCESHRIRNLAKSGSFRVGAEVNTIACNVRLSVIFLVPPDEQSNKRYHTPPTTREAHHEC
jgi:hypothetical protein